MTGTPVPEKSNDMLNYLYPTLKCDNGISQQANGHQILPSMSDKDVFKILRIKELKGLNPIVLIIYDIVYDLTNYNDHPGGKNILKKYNGTDCTQIFIDIGHNVDSLRYDINWKECVIGRYVNLGRANSGYNSKSNSNAFLSGNRQTSNFSTSSSIYSDSIYTFGNNNEELINVNEHDMLRQQVIVRNSDLRSNAGNIGKMCFWLSLMIISYLLFG
ncbi:hypothetical protein QEN19_001382 [Hanseniaspora menglaensis]